MLSKRCYRNESRLGRLVYCSLHASQVTVFAVHACELGAEGRVAVGEPSAAAAHLPDGQGRGDGGERADVLPPAAAELHATARCGSAIAVPAPFRFRCRVGTRRPAMPFPSPPVYPVKCTRGTIPRSHEYIHGTASRGSRGCHLAY